MSDDTGKTNQPEDRLREGALKSTIWRNEGENGPYFSAQYTRSYRDKNGNWQETQQMRENDHLTLGHLASRTHDRITQIKRAERENRPVNTPQNNRDFEPDR